jgi:hypothetical protein
MSAYAADIGAARWVTFNPCGPDFSAKNLLITGTPRLSLSCGTLTKRNLIVRRKIVGEPETRFFCEK